MQPTEQRITAHGLVIGLQDDWLAVRRNLDSPARNAQRPLPRRRGERLAEQTRPHAIRLRAELPDLSKKALHPIFTKTHRITAGNHPQQRRTAVIRQVRPRHAGGMTEGGGPTGEVITRLQRTPDAFSQLHTDTAQYRRGEKSASNRQIGILTTARKTHI